MFGARLWSQTQPQRAEAKAGVAALKAGLQPNSDSLESLPREVVESQSLDKTPG
jgi:hypothetical protein